MCRDSNKKDGGLGKWPRRSLTALRGECGAARNLTGRYSFGVCAKDRKRERTIEIGQYDTVPRGRRDWMATDEAKHVYLRRLPPIEPLFRIPQEPTRCAAIQSMGLTNEKAEGSLLDTTFNLRTLWRVWRSRLDTRLSAT